MTYIPVQLMIADITILVLITVGAIFLFLFLKSFGSEQLRKSSILLPILLIINIVVHEGSEFMHGLTGKSFGIYPAIIILITGIGYLIFAIKTKNQMKKDMVD